ncbi:MAG: response regulator [Luteitalea sp.]|nr:response regulator [Luteitalea sp.]
MSRVLVVEDDADIADLVRLYLQRAGHEVQCLHSGSEALHLMLQSTPDVVVLDRMLPGVDGLEILRLVRTTPELKGIPILMLTARAAEAERIQGLEVGADDYVTKPFSAKELVARVAALLRRTSAAASGGPQQRYGPILLDLDRHLVTNEGQEVRLTAKEFLLLQYFLEHRGRLLSREVLLTNVWGYTYTGGTRTVDVHIRRLREKLPLLGEAIETVKQFGYRLRNLEERP